jgi:hypothetical protein
MFDQKQIEALKNQTINISRCLALVEKYSNITDLTAEIAREFIDRIIVHEAVYKSPKIKESQKIQVILNFVGEKL